MYLNVKINKILSLFVNVGHIDRTMLCFCDSLYILQPSPFVTITDFIKITTYFGSNYQNNSGRHKILVIYMNKYKHIYLNLMIFSKKKNPFKLMFVHYYLNS